MSAAEGIHFMPDTIESLLAYCREDGRVCPMPILWDELWKMLAERTRTADGRQPPLPMILSGWSAPASMKIAQVEKQIRWAAEHGALEAVAQFLLALPESAWHHVGD